MTDQSATENRAPGSYEIGGATYTQKPLSLKRLRQLLILLKEAGKNLAELTAEDFMDLILLDGVLEKLLALMFPDGAPEDIELDQAAEVLGDFFTFNLQAIMSGLSAMTAPIKQIAELGESQPERQN